MKYNISNNIFVVILIAVTASTGVFTYFAIGGRVHADESNQPPAWVDSHTVPLAYFPSGEWLKVEKDASNNDLLFVYLSKESGMVSWIRFTFAEIHHDAGPPRMLVRLCARDNDGWNKGDNYYKFYGPLPQGPQWDGSLEKQ